MSLITPTQWGRAPSRIKRPCDRRSASRTAVRALDVLEMFGDQRLPLRAVEIGKALGMQPSTTGQLLKTMVESAHLVFDARAKTYFPSPRFASFGSLILENYGMLEGPQQLVQDVRSDTGGVVSLATPCGLFMQVIELQGRLDRADSGERGLSIPLFGSVMGSAYLATLPDDEVKRLGSRAQIPPANIFTAIKSFAAIRLEGYADGPTLDNKTWSVAVALPAGASPIPLVLGCSREAEDIHADCSIIYDAMRKRVEALFGREADSLS